jgi:3-methyladenine DNA glycosylase Tag
MKRSELEEMIEEEIYKYLQEKSVPQPYDRSKARKMSKPQISNREKIGKKMKSNAKTVARFKKKYGDEWEDYLWAAASSRALGGGFKKKDGESKESPKKSPKKSASKPKSEKKPRNKSDIKLTPAQKKNSDAMYKQLKRLSGVDETTFMNYVQKLDDKFSTLTENHANFDGPLMKKILHIMVEKLKPTGVQQ